MYLITGSSGVYIIDPSVSPDRAEEYSGLSGLASGGYPLKAIFLTHGHHDHIKHINDWIKAYPSAQVFFSSNDKELLSNAFMNCSYMEGSEAVYSFKFSNLAGTYGQMAYKDEDVEIKAYETPGHTMGSLCFLVNLGGKKMLFTGDTVFRCSVGRNMARNLIDDYGAFDHNAEKSNKADAGSVFRRAFRFLTNRYLVLAVGFSVFGVIILIMTIQLQFSGYQKTLSESSSGIIRQYSSQAPRGDIYDNKGVLLASTNEYNNVMIANAYLDDASLNSLCLELSYLFDQYHCLRVSDLDQYFVLDPKARFLKEEAKIRKWQTDTNLFDLKDYASGVIVTFSDDYVKTDPNVFFLYLRRKFNIDNSYTIDEAYRIIRIRYQIFSNNWAFVKGTPVKIATDVPDELIRKFEEQNYHYMGIVAGKVCLGSQEL